jgi:endonuclease-3 related protein
MLERIGIVPGDVSRKVLREAVMAVLEPDVRQYAEFHALIIQHGKATCRKTPRCEECVLLANCRYGERQGVPGVIRVRTVGSGVDHWSG